jgi:molybdopterin converting factor small subunit
VQVQVRFGAGLARAAGAPRLRVELPPEATVDMLLERVRELEPQIAAALVSVLPVVGGTQASRGQPLSDGDEVALLTPVAGGTPAQSDTGGARSWQ